MIRHRRALRRLLWSPGELGLARAFVAGELDVEGDLADGLSPVLDARATAQRLAGRPARPRRRGRRRADWRCGSARSARDPQPPASEARLDGRPAHPPPRPGRDRHHYDLSNDFYAFLLDPQMAYSCGYWTQEQSRPTASPTPSATSST